MGNARTLGTFKARAHDGTWGVAGTGTRQVGVRFVIIGGPYDGRLFEWYGHFNTAENTERAIASLERCGVDSSSGVSLERLDGLKTREVEVELEADEYEGRERIKVAWVNEPGMRLKPMPDAETFFSRLDAYAKNRPPSAVANPRANGRSADDDFGGL